MRPWDLNEKSRGEGDGIGQCIVMSRTMMRSWARALSLGSRILLTVRVHAYLKDATSPVQIEAKIGFLQHDIANRQHHRPIPAQLVGSVLRSKTGGRARGAKAPYPSSAGTDSWTKIIPHDDHRDRTTRLDAVSNLVL